MKPLNNIDLNGVMKKFNTEELQFELWGKSLVVRFFDDSPLIFTKSKASFICDKLTDMLYLEGEGDSFDVEDYENGELLNVERVQDFFFFNDRELSIEEVDDLVLFLEKNLN